MQASIDDLQHGKQKLLKLLHSPEMQRKTSAGSQHTAVLMLLLKPTNQSPASVAADTYLHFKCVHLNVFECAETRQCK